MPYSYFLSIFSRSALVRLGGVFLFVVCFASLALAQTKEVSNTLPPSLKEVGVTEKIGERLPLDALVRNAQGEVVPLKTYFSNNRPKILIFAYYTCPMLCGLVLDATSQAVSGVPGLGTSYDIITMSMDPSDTPTRAREYQTKYNKTDLAAVPWSFLVGEAGSEKVLADAAGFGYKRLEDGEYAHASLIMLVSGDGRMMRYLYGASYRPFDLKLGLAEAKAGHGVSSVERVLLFCYNYDPDSRGYVLFAVRMMRIAGLVTIFLLAGLLIWLARTSKGRKA